MVSVISLVFVLVGKRLFRGRKPLTLIWTLQLLLVAINAINEKSLKFFVMIILRRVLINPFTLSFSLL